MLCRLVPGKKEGADEKGREKDRVTQAAVPGDPEDRRWWEQTKFRTFSVYSWAPDQVKFWGWCEIEIGVPPSTDGQLLMQRLSLGSLGALAARGWVAALLLGPARVSVRRQSKSLNKGHLALQPLFHKLL